MAAIGQSEEVLALMPGQVLFQQGDPGGDLFFIQDGEIEIFRSANMQDVVLATMRVGEIIGIMTCMTNEPRMASARATKASIVKRVRHENVQKLIGNLPPWMKVVLKDFTSRLAQMNKNYAASIVEIKHLGQTQITKLYSATQIAATLASVAPLIKVKIDEAEGVYLEEITDKLEEFTLRPKEEIAEILDIFIEAGMIKGEKEIERKRTYITLANCQSVKNFSTWVAQAKSGQNKKLLQANFSNKEYRILSSIVRFARKLNLNLKSTVKIAVSDLDKSLEKTVGQKFEMGGIEQAVKLKLVSISGEGPARMVAFVPIELSRTMAHIMAYKKLEQLQVKADSEAAKKKGAA